MSELQESLDRAVRHLRLLRKLLGPKGTETADTLTAIVDTLVEMAAVLPAPHTIPKETR